MKIFNFLKHLNLTQDQHYAVQQLNDFLDSDQRVFILKGYAGSGKTTLLRGVVEYLGSIKRAYRLMAPTGRAAKVINQKTGFKSTTIHKGIYSFEELKEIPAKENDKNISFLYQYKLGKNNEITDHVMIVDEASMLSDILNENEFFKFGSGYLLRDLLEYARILDADVNTKIIFIGDPAQLPPIGMNNSPALDAAYLKNTYQLSAMIAEMKEVKRQDANNGILKSATNIRSSLESGYFNEFNLGENRKDIFNPKYEDFLNVYNSLNDDKIIICYKNKTALNLNQRIREDKFGQNLPIQPADTVIIGKNNYHLDIMNGEFAIVTEASPITVQRDISFYFKNSKIERVTLKWRKVSLLLPDENNLEKHVSGYILENYLYGDNLLKPEEERALYIDFIIRNPDLKKDSEEFKKAILNDEFFNCILLKFGYAVTCHKAQGGEWTNAIVFWDRGVKRDFNFLTSEQDEKGKTNADFYRWAYTAITRASEKLYCINPPYFNSYSFMNFVDVEVQQAYHELLGQTHKKEEIIFSDVSPILQEFNLLDASFSIQNHFIERWYHLRKHFIDIKAWQRHNYEIRYQFQREQETAGIMYWVNGKDEFNTKFQRIGSTTNSNTLYDEIIDILSQAETIEINRNNAEGILSKIIFEHHVELDKPFLKKLYDALILHLENEVVITDIKHLINRERYTFEYEGNECVIDFVYRNTGFFSSVQPLEHLCSNPILLNRIKTIINQLKNPNYVI
ncbi:AAA family ATPase [Weeksellaceae bacterium KMM 9713]|uniref:AAA family ATPase n=1 Tax=Profundicola chukchiensis TaxID=2961959 RepID=A0A9X4MX63_9FLAO|nr:AAA family ATPase [Profundicola chukchiensis]MDG4945753.1 AAA family ATPase [Profundicola chukchiensis]